ncbi:MAG TPA: YebC/PmpR family DNA-binding transcriptional regulator [Desulfohalobiaceae bacterium]|nr:YebC/PmpR family DNA-binding transcriptional regulator [Desulfohalobiaceae bacterium]
MAGHSKWANIKHRKGRQDAKRGQMFTKASKELMLSARLGGGDLEMNPRLRAAIEYAKYINMPKDKIETAIKKGTGEIASGAIEEVVYEGYGPGGVAVLVEGATDNKNRTVSEIRKLFSKSGGNLGEAGCVAWMFDKYGILSFDKNKYHEDQLLEIGLEAGVEDIVDENQAWEVRTPPEDFVRIKQAFEEAQIEIDHAEISMIPKNYVELDKETAQKALKLYEQLDDHDDVQKVHVNFEIPDELYEQLQ